jgi:AbrB family looped-hinge helix DNA binding protein
MRIKVSTKGQVVLPAPLRWQLNIRPGDPVDAEAGNGRIVLAHRNRRRYRVKFVTDPLTGFPALSAGPKAPALTRKDVEEILANFPWLTPL